MENNNIKDPMDMDAEEFLAFMEEAANKPLFVEEEEQTTGSNEEQKEEPVEDSSDDYKDEEKINNDDESENIKETDDSIIEDENDNDSLKDDESIDNVEIDDSVNQETKNIDDKILEEYEKLKTIKEKLSKKIVIDGVEVDAISDPDVLLKMQEEYAKAKKRLNEYKQVRPLIETLKENGLVDNKEDFALIIKASKGDKDAITALLKKNKIDPMELEVDEEKDYKVNPNEVITNQLELKFKDTINEASNLGIEKEFSEKIIDGWDNESITKLLNDDKSRSILLQHIKYGDFDKVKAKIIDLERIDFDGSFENLPDYDKYVIASNALKEEMEKQFKAQKQAEQSQQKIIEPDAAKQQEVVKQNKVQRKKRIEKAKRASEASKHVDTGSSKGVVSLDDMDNEEFMKYMYSMM